MVLVVRHRLQSRLRCHDGRRRDVRTERFHPRRQKIFHTYFTDGRGVEHLGSVWTFLDLTPYGRQEDWEDSPEGWPQTPPFTWWRYHDRYEGE